MDNLEYRQSNIEINQISLRNKFNALEEIMNNNYDSIDSKVEKNKVE